MSGYCADGNDFLVRPQHLCSCMGPVLSGRAISCLPVAERRVATFSGLPASKFSSSYLDYFARSECLSQLDVSFERY